MNKEELEVLTKGGACLCPECINWDNKVVEEYFKRGLELLIKYESKKNEEE